jgi:isoquinoline 1-oxidoreductase beta subunit
VAEKAGWGKPVANGDGRGIAHMFSYGSYVAHVAEVSVNEENGIIKVHRVVCAVDCGQVINPNTIVAQMEGGIIMGMSAALKEEVALADGGVGSRNFGDYPILQMSEVPEIEVHIVESGEKIGGIGETAVPPIAPAVGNAVFAATGTRLRRLPMTPKTVKEAMKKA